MLGIAQRTVSDWCAADPILAFKDSKGDYWVRIEEISKKPGFDLISALTLTTARWVKAVDLARVAGHSRRTMCYWCAHRPRFAKRIGRNWYVDLEAIGVPDDLIEEILRRHGQEA